MSLFNELKRRKVFRVAIGYVVAAWLIAQVADLVADNFLAPVWVMQMIITVLIVGLPISLILSWAFDLTPDGIKRTVLDDTGGRNVSNRLEFILIGGLVIVAAVTIWSQIPSESVKDLAQPSVGGEAQSIAVLPFLDMSQDRDQEYLGDGIAEELLNELSRLEGLRVAGRTSSFSFKQSNSSIQAIGESLGVDSVLEGSIRKDGSRVRITAKLVNSADGIQLWSETFERELTDIFAIQEEIAQSVVDRLEVRLVGNLRETRETTPEVYELFLQSRSLITERGPANWLQAESLLNSALEIDSNYVPSWLQLGFLYLSASGGGDPWERHEAYPRARAAAIEALRLDTDNAQAHTILAWLARAYEYDMEAARRQQKLAVALAPRDGEVLHSGAANAIIDGDYDVAIRLLKEAEIVDPLNPLFKRILARAYYFAGRFDQAIAAFKAEDALIPSRDPSFGRRSIVHALLASGDHAGALEETNKLQNPISRHADRALVFQAMGDTERSTVELNAFIEAGQNNFYVSIARVHAYRGELDEAFSRLERAFETRDGGLTFNMTGDPFFDNLREDPRFDALLERMGRTIH